MIRRYRGAEKAVENQTVLRPAMMYGSDYWALRKQEEHRLHTTQMKMLRWSQGKTRKNRIKK